MGLFEGRKFFLTSRPTLPAAGCSSYALRPGEACDNGNVVSDDGFSSDCQPESDFGCVVAGQPCEPTTSPE